MRKAFAGVLAATSFLVAGVSADALSQDARFAIRRFQVDGNTLLAADKVEKLLAPYVGSDKNYGDVQKALEALEGEFRRRGYGTVQVYVPEQEITEGVVRLQISEGVVGKVLISGNKYFNNDNIRASLPQLQEGKTPNMRLLSENVQLANESPAKQMEVTLATSDVEGEVDIKIAVKEDDPGRVFLTFDNTGTTASGKHRLGVSYQNANMFNRDQVLTLAYTSTPDAPSGVKVDIFSIGYRLPLYTIGDSVDLIYGNSSTNTPASVLAPGGALGLTGKGLVFGLRYNHIFPRDGEYTSKLVLGLDYKYVNSRCTVNGQPTDINPPGTVGSCTPYTVRPVSATYSGQWQRPGETIDFNLGVMYHMFPIGSFYQGPGGVDRYSFVTTRQSSDAFMALRAGGSYITALFGEWLGRVAVNGQYAHGPLPSGEQIGLVGGSTVRGFLERAVSADRGLVLNLELYTPEYATVLGVPGSLKGLAFYDAASGHNFAALNTGYARANVASAGVGLRYSLNKDISARFDVARVLEGHQPVPGAAEAAKPGDIRGHFGLALAF